MLGAILGGWSLEWYVHLVHPSWGAPTTWLTVAAWALLFLASIGVNGIAQAAVVRLGGHRPEELTLCLFGGVVTFRSGQECDPKIELWMSAAGLFANAIVGITALTVASVWYTTPARIPATPTQVVVVWLGYVNVLLAAVNVIPAFPLGGGRMARALLMGMMREGGRATHVAARFGQGIALVAMAYGVISLAGGVTVIGFWILVLGWVVLEIATVLDRRATYGSERESLT